MANNIWSNYTEKTATPVDADEVMVRDSTDGKNKRLLFGTFWKWVAKKLNEATISELETENKTIIGAINALNSESVTVFASTENAQANTNFLIPLPSGFTRDNCYIGGARFYDKNYKTWYSYYNSNICTLILGDNITFNSSVDAYVGSNAKIEVILVKK